MNEEISEAKSELEAAQSALEAALRAWDESVLTQAQKRVTRAYEPFARRFGDNEPIRHGWINLRPPLITDARSAAG
jgi:hypothetical protein